MKIHQFNKLIDLAIKLEKYDDAFSYIQLAKGRSLTERVFIDKLSPIGVPSALFNEYKRFRDLKEQLTSAILSGNMRRYEECFAEWLNTSRSYRGLMERLQKYDPDFVKLVNSPNIPPVKLSLAFETCPSDTLLIEMYVTFTQTIFFMISPVIDIAKCVITIPEMNIMNVSEKTDKINDVFQNFFDNTTKFLEYFDNAYEPIISMISELLWNKLKTIIETETLKHIVFLPNRELHIIPLHLLAIKNSRFLCGISEVSYAPNYQILMSCLERSTEEKPHHVLIVENPIENPNKSLKFAAPEAIAIESYVSKTTRLIKEDATKQKIQSLVKDVDAIHFITHGYFSSSDIKEISLELYDGELNFEEIIGNYRFRSCNFALLSACETGKVKVDESDEYIGLNHAFIYAGANTVISSLWSVDDLSTMLFVQRWYKNYINEKMSKCASLREAQLWLKNATWDNIRDFVNDHALFIQMINHRNIHHQRSIPIRTTLDCMNMDQNEKPFEHPYYWAPFCCYGN